MISALLVGSGGGAACAGGGAGGGAGAAAGFISAAGGGTGAGAGWDESEGSVCKGCNGPILIVSTGSWAWASKETMTSAEIRMTNECQNPNDEGVSKPWGGAVSSCFVIRDSFVILNSSFVIRHFAHSAHGLRHSLESSFEAAALSAMVSVFGSHLKPVLPLRSATLAR